MTTFLLYLLLWIWDNRSFEAITDRNRAKTQAEIAYAQGNYPAAADLYRRITYGSIFSEAAARLNLAHAYYQLGNQSEAKRHYGLLIRVEDLEVASEANAQLALIAASAPQKDTLEALSRLKTALRQNPDNDRARFNYELLKERFSGQIPPTEPTDNPPPKEQPPASEGTSPPTEEGQSPEQVEQREQLLNQLKQLNMSEDQARAILDAMKTNEMQYIYQLRRRQYSTQASRSTKTEW
ncbi:hypothetical protein GCM10027275_11900 [Rhabdobacter roseus]|uniref:Tetratricopeptide (TPR) repeat protein n=1 Tax=Rhabdobacter roseus TaxID=1655419 RepID=A0A840TPF5_9BACT|nr:hypothetical protein [Rhabdobacter roseus]MBB5283103.1 tetratricopeptide (TPR) repeat protein [Rhabdobacter roseus]